MRGFVANLEQATLDNEDFRRVLYTTRYCQLVVMSLQPGEEIGSEVHELDQFIRVERGKGKAVLNGVGYDLADGSAVVVPAGIEHNIVNASNSEPLKLYTLYAPPEHRDGTVHATRADAVRHEEHFDGFTSEVA